MDHIHTHYWTYNPRYLLYISSFMSDEDWRLSVADVDGAEEADRTNTRLLTPAENVQARLQLRSPLRPDEILVCLNERDPIYHDVYRINFVTGEKELHELNDIRALDYFFDNEFNTRFARTSNPDGSISVLVPDGSGGWDKVMEIPAEDALTTHFLNFDITGRYAYMQDSRGQEHGGAYRARHRDLPGKAARQRSAIGHGGLHVPSAHRRSAGGGFRRRALPMGSGGAATLDATSTYFARSTGCTPRYAPAPTTIRAG